MEILNPFPQAMGNLRSQGVAMGLGVQTDMATPALARFGSDELREQFLRPSINGDMVACLGVSEVGAGSDVSSIKTTARRDGDDYVINGSKIWTSDADKSDWIFCLVRTASDGKQQEGIILKDQCQGLLYFALYFS